MTIKNAVGVGAKNEKEDVAIIQGLVNEVLSVRDVGFSRLAVDGLFGPATGAAIRYLQEKVVKLSRPDGVVDVNGMSLRVIRKLASSPQRVLAGAAGERKKAKRVIELRKNALPLLSEYTENVLEFAMALGEVEGIDVSSTLRRVEDQARIMFHDNDAARKAGKTVREYRGYGYGPVGQAVDEIYAKNVGRLSDPELEAAMAEEIRRNLALGKRTSRHCVEESDYAKNNILDVPYSGVRPEDRRDEFEGVLISLAESFNKRKYSDESVVADEVEDYAGLKLIDKVIVERRCWHLEIPQDGKAIPDIQEA